MWGHEMTKIEAIGNIVEGPPSSTGRLTTASRKQGYVALLDVLSFRNLIRSEASDGQIVQYIGTMEQVLDDSRIESVVFSDSIVITKESRDPDSLRVLCEVCSRLMLALILVDVPIRGAIACGHYLRSTVGNSVFLAGNPIIEAFEYEKKQNWIGVTLTPSALQASRDERLEVTCNTQLDRNEAFPDVANYMKWKAHLQRCATIPYRIEGSPDTHLHDGFAIVPGGDADFATMALNLKAVFDRLQWLRILAPSPNEQAKYDSTIKWISPFVRTWQGWAAEYQARRDKDVS
jgi:hypothetical protein